MKNLFIIFFLVILSLPCLADEKQRFKGYFFSPIYYDMYKRPVITWENHNKTVNYHAGAQELCKSLGMRLPNKLEADILTDYLTSSGITEKKNLSFWLQDIATGQIGNTYINGTDTHAYTLGYNSIIRPIRSYLSPMDKTSGISSSVCTICIQEAPAPTINDIVYLFKEDYEGFLKGKNAFYGYVDNAIKDSKIGINTKVNKIYLQNIKNRLDNIVAGIDLNNNLTPIIVKQEDQKKLTEKTINLIFIFNQIVKGEVF